MAASFLHGVETIEIEKGARTIKTVKTAVIGRAKYRIKVCKIYGFSVYPRPCNNVCQI